MSLAQRFDLTGVLETGETRDPRVPQDPRVALCVQRGAPFVVALTVLSASGAPVDLANRTVRFAVYRATSQPAVFAVEAAPAGANTGRGGPVELAVAAAQAGLLAPGVYIYEVAMRTTATPTDFAVVVPCAELRVQPAPTWRA